jgi:alpha-galactosidase
MTLWCVARSPLILGGNLPKNDEFTLALLTNDEVLAVNQDSTDNRQLFNTNNAVAWVADVPGSKDKYIALFNTAPAPMGGGRRGRGGFGGPGGTAPALTNAPAADLGEAQPRDISVSLLDIGVTGPAKVRDLWNQRDLGTATEKLTQTIKSHGAGLYRVQPQN